jgi:hypothetical protein
VYKNNELLFPHRSIGSLRHVRNGQWRDLVERIADLPETDPDSLAFSLMMIKLCGCLKCQPGSYKLSLGCSTCAKRTLASFKRSDAALMRRFQSARKEIDAYLASHGPEDSH